METKKAISETQILLRNIMALLLLGGSLFSCAPPGQPQPPTPPINGGGGPQFVINSPQDGVSTAGTLFFSVQPFNPAEVASVNFKAGDIDLGTDSTPEDGFKVFFIAKDHPEGPLDLTATVTGRDGRTSTQTITVNNLPNPPSRTTVTADGAALGTVEPNGALSTLIIPPGAADGATVSFEARTKEQVKAETGVDYDALGVTFLGAQEIESSQPIDQALMVASGGYGPMVQPGQVVVNYMIAPDGDGDGIGELVVAVLRNHA